MTYRDRQHDKQELKEIFSALRSASTNPSEYRSCTVKKFFRTEALAKREIDKGLRKGYLYGVPRIYKCIFCVGHHISTKPHKLDGEADE